MTYKYLFRLLFGFCMNSPIKGDKTLEKRYCTFVFMQI